jgi:hypothetical protein
MVILLELCAVLWYKTALRTNGKPAMIYFSSVPIPQAETTGSSWTLDRKKRLLRSNIFVPEKRFFSFV